MRGSPGRRGAELFPPVAGWGGPGGRTAQKRRRRTAGGHLASSMGYRAGSEGGATCGRDARAPRHRGSVRLGDVVGAGRKADHSLRLRAAVALDQIEFDLFTFAERLITILLNCG